MTAKLKAVYSVTELAALTGVSRYQMHRLLRRHEVTSPDGGSRRKVLVPLDSFRSAFPAVWESILTSQALGG